MTIEERLSVCDELYKRKNTLLAYDIFDKDMDNIVTITNEIMYFYWRVYEDGTAMVKDDTNLMEPLYHEGKMTTNLRRHDFMQLCYVYKGTYRQFIENQLYEFNKGDLILMDQHSMHYELLKDGDCFVIYIGMDTQLFKTMYMQALEQSSVDIFLNNSLNMDSVLRQVHIFNVDDKGQKINELISMILNEMDQKSVAWDTLVTGALTRLMHIMLSSHNDIIMVSKEDKESRIFNQVITFINKHYSTVSIKDLMEEFHYNEAYYSRLLKKFTTYNYRQYLQRLRLNKAKELLRTTDLAIDEIMIKVGYKNRGYFYRAFKNSEKKTPQMYRELSKHKNGSAY